MKIRGDAGSESRARRWTKYAGVRAIFKIHLYVRNGNYEMRYTVSILGKWKGYVVARDLGLIIAAEHKAAIHLLITFGTRPTLEECPRLRSYSSR